MMHILNKENDIKYYGEKFQRIYVDRKLIKKDLILIATNLTKNT